MGGGRGAAGGDFIRTCTISFPLHRVSRNFLDINWNFRFGIILPCARTIFKSLPCTNFVLPLPPNHHHFSNGISVSKEHDRS